MKFRFCGEGDCPDWVLAEIIATLSVISVQKLESLAQRVVEKITTQAFQEEAVKALTAEVSDDGKTAVACVHFLLISAARHAATESVFQEELQQLGLPKDHSEAMCRVLAANAGAIRRQLIEQSFKINELTSMECLPPAPSTINCVTFELKIAQELVEGLPQDTSHTLNMDHAHAKALLAELKEARGLMEKYDFDNVEKVET